MASFIAIIRYALLETFFCISILAKTLATLSALPPSSVKNILYGKSQDPKIMTLKKLCDGLEITLGEFFTTPEFDGLEQEIK